MSTPHFFSSCCVEPIFHMPGIMDQFEYIKILEGVMLHYSKEEMVAAHFVPDHQD